jgi:hypothetical protein
MGRCHVCKYRNTKECRECYDGEKFAVDRSDKVSVIRVIIYEGDRNWIEDTIRNNAVPLEGTKKMANGSSIRSILVYDGTLEKEA